MKKILLFLLAFSFFALSAQTSLIHPLSGQAELNTLTVNFSMMSPHVGQDIWLTVIDKGSMTEISRVQTTGEQAFVIEIPGILEDGKSYQVDFFADNNKNGYYDPPSVDHAWRLEIEDALGDETLEFSHQIAFTDVEWKHRLRLALSGMAANTGQETILFVRDQSTGSYLDTITVESIPGDEFIMASYVIGPGASYMLDFFVDLNGNGLYDAPPVDQAWRLLSGTTVGDLELEFSHNQDFTDIFLTSGLSDEEENLALSIYPNPAGNFLNIFMDTDPGSIASISVLNMAGSVLSRTEVKWPGSMNLDIGHLPDGIYILQVESDSRRTISRFIKQ